MKQPIALLLAVILLGVRTFAAEPVVEIKSATDVRVDGVSFGAVADCIANNPKLAPAIQRALVAWTTQVQAAQTAAEATAVETQAIVTRAKVALAKQDHPALTAALEDAEKPAKARKRAEISKQIADLQAQRAALDDNAPAKAAAK